MKEPSTQEMRFIEMLNRLHVGWGDHLNQLEEEKSFIQPVIWQEGGGQEYVVEITTDPVIDHDEERASVIRVFLEIRQRGQDEGLITRLDWPAAIDVGMDDASVEALGLFFSELTTIGFPADLLPSR